MTRRIYIECGAAETRAALLIDDEPIRFWFAPARGDEHLPRPAETGEIFLGRVTRISKSLHAAFIDIGEAENGYLQAKKSEKLPVEGVSIVVAVKRPAMGAKGALVSTHWEQGLSAGERNEIAARAAAATPPLRLSELRDPALTPFVAGQATAFDAVVINDADAAQVLRSYSGISEAQRKAITFADFSLRNLGVDESIEGALERCIKLEGGARLIFDETEAMTVVDVDSGGAGAGRASAINDRVNEAAAGALFRELARRAGGGRILVDFLPPSNAKARGSLLERMTKESKAFFQARFGKLTTDGVFDMTAPRMRASLLERASEPAGAGWVRPGRCFTCDWQAKTAIRTLEERLRAATSARLTLAVGEETGEYLAERPQWRERLAAHFGARFDIITDRRIEERAFDVAERR